MIPMPRKATRSVAGPAVAAPSRGFDPESVTGAEATRALAGQLVAVQRVPPRPAVRAAVGTGRPVAAAFGDQREAHAGERLDLAAHAVAAPLPALAARSRADRVLDRAHRELAL